MSRSRARSWRRARQKGAAASMSALESAHSVAGAVMLGQEETNWCWAAVTQAILHLRNRSKSQEEIVTDHLQAAGRDYTCSGPNRDREDGGHCSPTECTASCNDMHSVQIGLAGEGLNVRPISFSRPPTYSAVEAQIKDQRPVPCHVQWQSGTAHAVLIVGCSNSGSEKLVQILDPHDASAGQPVSPRPVPHSSLARNYRSSRTGDIGGVLFAYSVA